jgi:large subunit ribosomal protein L35
MFSVVIRPGELITIFLTTNLTTSIISAFRNFAGLAVKRIQNRATSKLSIITRNFSQLSIQPAKPTNFSSHVINPPTNSVLSHPDFLKLTTNPGFTQVRTVTKFSMKTGKRKSVKAATKRFKRLDWNIWIRTRTARHKRIWRKSGHQRRRAKQHVFVNATQSWLLDKMVTTFWRRPKNYVDDPYEPYQKRENYPVSRKKPFDWNN